LWTLISFELQRPHHSIIDLLADPWIQLPHLGEFHSIRPRRRFCRHLTRQQVIQRGTQRINVGIGSEINLMSILLRRRIAVTAEADGGG
jgi:hypothetical protein